MLTKAFYAAMICVLVGFCLAAKTAAPAPTTLNVSQARHALTT